MAAQGRRIAFVVRELSERVGDTAWIDHLTGAGHRVDVIVLDPQRGAPAPSDVAVHSAPANGRAAGAAAVRRVIARNDYDTVVALRTGANLVAAAALSDSSARQGIRLLVTEDVPLSLRAQLGGPAHRRRSRQAKKLYRHADVVLSASHPVAAEMTAAFGVPASRSLVVPPPALAGAPLVVDAGTGPGIRLLLLGDLVAEQNPLLALHAAALLAARGLDVDVHALHGGPLQREVAELARTLGVTFTAADETPAGARRAVAVLSAPCDGQGALLIQAAAGGIPSVAISTALGVADAVVPGVTGELALDDAPASLADAIHRAAALPAVDADAWLTRFRPSGSGALLHSAIDYAHGLPAA